jgi:hypothetical protein
MRILRRMLRKEAGQILPMALVLLLLGDLAIFPTLSLATTNLKATQRVDEQTREMYAADAGINNALWYLQSDNRTEIINPTLEWPITYHLDDFQQDEQVNDRDVEVRIGTAWLLDIPEGRYGYTNMPDTEPTPGIFPNANDLWHLITALNMTDNSTYVIQVSTTAAQANNQVDNISVWMPRGYTYVPGSVRINNVPIGGPGTGFALVTEPAQHPLPPDTESSYRGGTIYKWEYLGTTFNQLAAVTPPPPGGGLQPAQRFPPSIQLSLTYTITPFTQANGFFAWIQLADHRIAWDTDTGFFHIQSTSFVAGQTDNTTVAAYVPRGMPHFIGGAAGGAAAVQGDYIAIGNSLMTCCWHNYGTQQRPDVRAGPPCDRSCDWNDNGKYYTESSATINNDFGPPDAQIERAYLYWTAWVNNISKVDTSAMLKVNGTPVGTDGTVTADRYYTMATSSVPGGYQYACFVDVSDRVRALTTTLRNTMFTVGGVNATPATTCASDLKYQVTNAGWSMIIIYSSQDPNVGVHQIYMYDNLAYLWGNGSTVSATFTISGFEAPDINIDAKVGYFVAEGDPQISPDSFQFRGQQSALWVYLGDPNSTDHNYYRNVYNSYSTSTGFTPSPLAYPGGETGIIGGVDLDIYNKDRNGNSLSSIVQPGDTQAQILVQTQSDGIMIVFVVFSVTSTAVTPGEEFDIGSMLYSFE